MEKMDMFNNNETKSYFKYNTELCIFKLGSEGFLDDIPKIILFNTTTDKAIISGFEDNREPSIAHILSYDASHRFLLCSEPLICISGGKLSEKCIEYLTDFNFTEKDLLALKALLGKHGKFSSVGKTHYPKDMLIENTNLIDLTYKVI